MTAQATISETLADWIAGFDPASLPDAARQGCADTILDTICPGLLKKPHASDSLSLSVIERQ